jgi:hypothetical protein
MHAQHSADEEDKKANILMWHSVNLSLCPYFAIDGSCWIERQPSKHIFLEHCTFTKTSTRIHAQHSADVEEKDTI